MRKTALLFLIAGVVMLAAPAFAQNQRGIAHPCDRACLTGFVDAWLNGLIANDASAIPLAPGAKITLNDDIVAPRDAFWDQAASVQARIDIANPRWGDTGTQTVITNEDGSQYIYVPSEGEGRRDHGSRIHADPQRGGRRPVHLATLQTPNPNFNTPIRPAEQDSYYDLVAAAEGYWRAFNTNGTPDYHPAAFWPNVRRVENGVDTTGVAVAGNPPMSAAEQFDLGFHAGRNIWDLRYPVVDEEYGVVMSFARFGMKTGAQPLRAAQRAERLVAEFFAVRKGLIWDIQAVMVNRDEALPSAGRRTMVPRAAAGRPSRATAPA
jgi:hypothetical protein